MNGPQLFIMALVLAVFSAILAGIEYAAHRSRKRFAIFQTLFVESFANNCGWGFDVTISHRAPASLPEPTGRGPFMIVKKNGLFIAAFRFHKNATLSGVVDGAVIVYASIHEAATAVRKTATARPLA